LVCHYVPGTGTYKTLCLSQQGAWQHQLHHSKDYCGPCLADTFVETAVRFDIPPEAGEEILSNHRATYNVTFYEGGLVSLAVAYQNGLIESIGCGPNSMEIEFKRPPSPDLIDKMFPESSLVVVDGILFDTTCYLGNDPDVEPLLASGFLVVQVVEQDAYIKTLVTVEGIEVSYNYLFQEQYLYYEEIPAPGRRLAQLTLEATDKIPDTEDPPIQLVSTAGITVTAGARFVKKEWRLRGRRWWKLDPYINLRARFRFQVDFGLSQEIIVLPGSKSDNLTKMILEQAIPGAGIKLPSAIAKVLNWILPDTIQIVPEAGLTFKLPIVLEYALKLQLNLGLKATATYTTGRKEVEVRVEGGLLPDVDIDMVVDERPETSGLQVVQPVKSEAIAELASTLDIFGGFKPQVALKAIGKCLGRKKSTQDIFLLTNKSYSFAGLASASVGVYAGADLNTKFKISPTPPFPALADEPGLPY